MIYYTIPWNTDKNIGVYYNIIAAAAEHDNDYLCFIDADATFTTHFFGKQLEDIIKKYPECGLFTAKTNRVGCQWQLENCDWNNNDIAYHRAIGQKLYETRYDRITDVSDKPRNEAMSGVLILIRKSLWKSLGGFIETGMLGVDNDIMWKAQSRNEKIYLMNGVYLYHWYRGGDKNSRSHLL